MSDSPMSASKRLATVAAAAACVVVAGLFLDARRGWTGWLLGFVMLAELSLSGLLFLALLAVSNARWADALKPVPRAMAGALPVACMVGLALMFGVPTLYEWAHGAAHDELLARKSAWLNLPGFALRMIACFAAWLLFSFALRRRLAPPEGRNPGPTTGRDVALAAGFVAVFAITWSIASIDWIQSLEPHWFSTIFALRTASGLVVSGLAAATILVVLLCERGVLRGRVSQEHVHDLGKLLLSFSVLWVYVWYCQYMLIWYSDIPEEAIYFARRAGSGWSAITWASLGLGFVVPFLALLSWHARRSTAVLLRVAFVLLVAQALDLYGMIGPGIAGPAPSLGVYELAGIVAALALFFSLATKGLAGAGNGAHLEPDPGGPARSTGDQTHTSGEVATDRA